MKTPIKKVAKLLILLAIILLFSCTKDPGYIDSKRLTKVYLDTFLLHQIEYDSQLKMISLETFHKHFKVLPDNSYWDYWSVLIDFEYEDGKLTKVNHDLGYDLLEYNSENLLSHVTLYTEGGTTRGEYQYQYDSMKRLSSFDGITFEYDFPNFEDWENHLSVSVYTKLSTHPVHTSLLVIRNDWTSLQYFHQIMSRIPKDMNMVVIHYILK